jgi:hypothetical protein
MKYMEINGKKSAKLKDPQLNCFLCMSSVQLRRGMSCMHHFSLLTMTINRINHPSYLNKKEKGERYNLYVNKCQVLKIIDLLKMSFRINLKCKVHNILISISSDHDNK